MKATHLEQSDFLLSLSAVLSAIIMSAGAAQAEITWTGAIDNNWDASTANWSGDSTVFTDDGTVDVTFNSPVGGTITIVPNVSPQSTTVSAESGTYTFSGGPIDSGTLTKSGGGTLYLSGANTYVGKTTVQEGTLDLGTALTSAGVAGPLGMPTGVNATIDLFNGAKLRSVANVTHSTDRTINLAGAGSGTVTLEFNNNRNLNQFGSVAATGTGAKTLHLQMGLGGLGDWVKIRFNGGISDVDDGSALGLHVQFAVQAAGGGPVYLAGTNTFSGPINVAGANKPGSLYISGTGVLGDGLFTNTISLGSSFYTFYYDSSADQALAGEISGAGGLALSGNGILTLSSENTYGGGTSIANGTLYANATGALGTGDVSVATSGLLVMNENNAMSSASTLTLPNDTTQTIFMNQTRCEIASLVINSITQSNGVYYSSQNNWMGGSGRLFVGVPAPAAGTVIILN